MNLLVFVGNSLTASLQCVRLRTAGILLEPVESVKIAANYEFPVDINEPHVSRRRQLATLKYTFTPENAKWKTGGEVD